MVKAVDKARGDHRRPGRDQDRRQVRRLVAVSATVSLRAAVVVASNRAAAGVYDDTTGPLIVDVPARAGLRGAATRSSYPTASPVGAAIAAAVAGGARVVLTTGGTGLTPTDRTPEVTRPLLDCEVPGIAEAIRAYGVAQGRADRRAVARPRRRRRRLPGGQPARLARRGEGRPRGARAAARARRRAGRRERPLSATPGWPARLRHGEVTLRPLELRRRDGLARPSAAATPPGCGRGTPPCRPAARAAGDASGRWSARLRPARPATGRRCRSRSRSTAAFAGQVTVNNIVRGSAQFASVGYWLDRDVAGRGVMPRAVALVIDHCFLTAGLHRIEIAIRPENSNSLRVVEKLGIREVGYAPRFLHIDGAWRDHRIYAVTVEECPGRDARRLACANHTSHTSNSATHLWTSARTVR